MRSIATAFTRQVGIDIPIICGAMYPCSSPELVAAVSAAGGIGIVQPMSLVFAFGREFKSGLSAIREAAQGKPIGLNLIIEKTARIYEERARRWLDDALALGVRFFITALGDPTWVTRRVHTAHGVVYHDVTNRHWAEKALAAGVDGLICVNSDAGGHAGEHPAAALATELGSLGVPLICAGGIGAPDELVRALDLGYAGVQMGTRFIATPECKVHPDYKQAILRARPDDIVLTERLTGVPCAVIRTPYVRKMGTRAGRLARLLLRGRRTKRVVRSWYALQSIWRLRQAALKGARYHEYFQAGKSVGSIHSVEPAAEVVRTFGQALREHWEMEPAREQAAAPPHETTEAGSPTGS